MRFTSWRRFFAFVVGFVSSAPLLVLAQPVIPVPVEDTGGLYDIVCNIANWIFGFVMIIAVIVILLAAIRFFTAAGHEQAIHQAREYLQWALVGVAIAVLAKGLVYVIGSLVGAEPSGFFITSCAG